MSEAKDLAFKKRHLPAELLNISSAYVIPAKAGIHGCLCGRVSAIPQILYSFCEFYDKHFLEKMKVRRCAPSWHKGKEICYLKWYLDLLPDSFDFSGIEKHCNIF